jgi:hypothetical protein
MQLRVGRRFGGCLFHARRVAVRYVEDMDKATLNELRLSHRVHRGT